MAIDAATYRLAMTGYVEQGAGSVASANAVVLRRLLEKCCEILFFSKPDFVDPRPMVEETDHKERFVYVDTTGPVVGPGRTPSGARQANVNALLRPLTRRLEPSFHRRRVNRRMVQVFAGANSPDACLWLGLPASGAVPGAPTVSWLQGPPGTDARSIERHADEIRQLGGRALLWKLRAYAAWRLGAGLPRYEHSDALVVGSEWSRRTMTDRAFIAQLDGYGLTTAEICYYLPDHPSLLQLPLRLRIRGSGQRTG